MSGQARLAPAFPPTPEDEPGMAQLHTGSGRAKSMGGHVAMRPDKVGMGDNGDNNIAHTPTSPSSSLALSRFEFEPGKGNEGTKVLMVEWQLSAIQGTQPGTHRLSGDSNPRSGRSPGDTAGNNWSVTWEGKDDHNVLAASDNTGGTGTDSTERRMYFLLPPGATIPPLINIHCVGHGSTTAVHSDEIEGDDTTPIELWTRPMPAIYPASLGPEAKQAGWRGVLHSLWAKHKLAGLAAEIEAEMRANSESIGLQIALQEHCWVSAHFGNGGPKAPTESSPCPPHPAKDIARVVMPRSPVSGKLGEKLKGLRLATSPAELAAALHATSVSTRTDGTTIAHSAGVVDESGRAAFGAHIGIHNSLDAVIVDNMSVGSDVHPVGGNVDAEDELFALPLSPRSPEMARSPFSAL